MATTKTFNTRLQLKYDSYTNWSTNNPVLLQGEVALTTIPTTTGDVQQVPAVMMKVGDGTTAYNDLKFLSGLAANVYNWALAATKPVYTADEIDGLSDYISGEIQDTNTTYQLVKVDDYNYKLQSKEINGSWADVPNGAIVIPKYDDTAVKADITALQGLVGATSVAAQIAKAITDLDLANTYEAKGAAGTALTNAKAYTDTLANGAVKTNTDAIAAIKDGTTIDSFSDVETALAGKETAGAAADALADAKEYTDALANGAVKTAQDEVDALETKVGVVPEGKTVVQMISEAQSAATYDDTQVKADIKANADAIDAIEADYLKAADKTELQGNIDTVSGKVTTLIGTDADKSVRTIANEELAAQLIPGTATESLDTLKEIADWIQQHPEDAATMNTNIGNNTTAIEGLDGRLDTAEGKILTLEGASHSHDNKALLDTYTQTEANLADAVTKKHDHANATVLDGIKDTDITNWNETATGFDELVADIGTIPEGKTVVQMISEAQTAATYDDTEVRGLIKDNADAIDAVEGRVGTLETNAVLVGDTLILNCGNSVIA